MAFTEHFGSAVRKQDLSKFSNSKHWNGKKFRNLSVTKMDVNLKTLPGLLKENLTDRDKRSPEKPLRIHALDCNKLNNEFDQPKFIWFGHSVLLFQLKGKNYLIDPMFGPSAAPIAPFGVNRFTNNTIDLIDQLPDIEAVLITHDHYDHLDYESIQKLKPKINKWFVALGVSRHLESWGIPANQITEFDWWQELKVGEITITFTPSRHLSGRGLFDRAKSLWGGWVIRSNEHKIYWSGDGGYDTHFSEVGEKYGPFDIAFLECGQYNERWHSIHMYPEESVRAAIESNSKIAVPVHWGAFALALHPWKEPVNRFTKEAKKQRISYMTPLIGKIYSLIENDEKNEWWTDLQ